MGLGAGRRWELIRWSAINFFGKSMIRTTTRSFKTTRTLILSGLVVAGMVGNTAVKTFAASGTFALTGSLNTARWGHTATLLPSGEVLVAGGFGTAGEGNPIAGAELYNPATGKWTATGSMSSARVFFTATLLSTGRRTRVPPGRLQEAA